MILSCDKRGPTDVNDIIAPTQVAQTTSFARRKPTNQKDCTNQIKLLPFIDTKKKKNDARLVNITEVTRYCPLWD